ncbi:mechanosensitive ion channel [Candidatus Gracilibacteria bacterium]|nr:mechanosensitive ion channel [Candidatus Gracilibacteria bacterium]
MSIYQTYKIRLKIVLIIILLYNLVCFTNIKNKMQGENAQEATSGLFGLQGPEVWGYILKIFGGVIVIIVMLIISKIVAGIVKRNIIKNNTITDSKHIDKIAGLIGNIVFYIMVIFSFFIGFEIMGFNVGLILGGVSFGVGLAFKEILGNMIAGIMILYTKEFKLGDIVEINADQVYFGRIEEITIRYTIIRTLDLREVIIPNMTLISVPIKTFSSEELVKLNFMIGVHYESDIPKTIEVLTNCINSFDFVKSQDNTKVFVTNFGASSIDMKCMFLFDPKGGLLEEYAIGAINEKINEEFKKNNINIPYNMITLNFEKEKDQENTINNIQ